MDFFEVTDFIPRPRDESDLMVKDYSAHREEGNSFNVFGDGRNLGVIMNRKRFFVFISFLIILWSLIFIRAFYLQVIRGDYYRSLAEGNRIRIERIDPKRGMIYDVFMNPLLKNVANFSLRIIPADLPKDAQELFETQESVNRVIVGQKVNLLDYISKDTLANYQPRIIKESLEYEEAMKFIALSKDLKGISVVTGSKREYNLVGYFSHMFGYLGKISEKEYEDLSKEGYYLDDKIGKSGLEYIYETNLRGQFGKSKIEIDSLGREKKILAVEKPIDGENIILSIDGPLQLKITDLLLNVLKKNNLNKASVIAIDPRNGAVLALVSMPTYDNNIFSGNLSKEQYSALVNDKDQPMFFRAISGEYPPGSTFKIMMASAGLESGIADENTSFLSTGGINVGAWFFPDWKSGGHGMTNVKKAIAESVNTYFYNIGGGYNDFHGLGLDKINFYAKQFGFASKTNIDLPGEAEGFMPTEEWKKQLNGEPWYIGDTYHVSIGQGDVLATPLQIAMMTSVVANGGILYEPRVVDKIGNIDSPTRRPAVIRNSNFISEKNIQLIQEGMRMAVTDGSCRGLSTLPIEAAGKTGTAQFANNSKTHAWFTGYAPYNDPNIVLTVLIDGGGEGSSIAVPLARDILLWYFKDRFSEQVVQ